MTQDMTVEEQGRQARGKIFDQIPFFRRLSSRACQRKRLRELPEVAEILDGLATGLTNRSRDSQATDDWIEELQRVVMQLQGVRNDANR